MEHAELTRLWHLAPETDAVDAETLRRVEQRSRRLDRTLLWRDVREVAAGLLAAVAMGAVSLTTPGWVPRLGAAAMLAGIAYPLARLLAARRRHLQPPGDLPVVERLRREVARLDTQVALLRSVRSWYLAPLSLGGLAWMLSIAWTAPVEPALRWGLMGVFALGGSAVFLAVGWVVERLNHRAAEHLESERADVQDLVDGLEEA